MGQGVIPDDWTNEYCRYSVCWPNSPQWLAVLRGVLTLPATGRFWDEHTGTITEAQAVIRETFDTNLHLQEVIMACGDQGLTQIAAALRLIAANQGCCVVNVNGGVQGSVSDGAGGTIPIIGSQPGASLDPGTFPEGYDNLDDYLLDKCRMANLITDGLISTLQTLAGFDLLNMGGLAGLFALALFGVIVIPEVAIPVIVGALAVLAVAGSALIGAATYITDNREQFVCALYQGDSADAIIATLADLFDELIAFLEVSTPIGIALKSVLIVLIGPDTVNRLFTHLAGVGYPDADCSACGEFSIVIDDNRGTIEGEFPNYVVTSSLPIANGVQRGRWIRQDGECFKIVSIEFSNWFTANDIFGNSGVAVQDECLGDINPVPFADVENMAELEAYLTGKCFRYIDIASIDRVVQNDNQWTATFEVAECDCECA